MAALADHRKWGTGYSKQQSTRPQTVGYGLVDSPAGQLAWIVEKFWAWTDCDGHPENALSRDELLDNVMVYWVTDTAASSARLYWESFQVWRGGNRVELPTGVAAFPKELLKAPRSWCEPNYNITHWTDDAARRAFRRLRAAGAVRGGRAGVLRDGALGREAPPPADPPSVNLPTRHASEASAISRSATLGPAHPPGRSPAAHRTRPAARPPADPAARSTHPPAGPPSVNLPTRHAVGASRNSRSVVGVAVGPSRRSASRVARETACPTGRADSRRSRPGAGSAGRPAATRTAATRTGAAGLRPLQLHHRAELRRPGTPSSRTG